MKRGQNLQTLKDNNLAVVLSTIWEYENISRAELAKITGLAPSSVTRLTRELYSIGLITETGKGKSSGGRQPVLISPNPDAGIVISFDLSGSSIRGGVFNTANHLLKVQEIPRLKYGPNAILDYIYQLMNIFLNDEDLRGNKLLGIGVSIPGVINGAKEEISISYNLRLKDFPLKKILEDKYRIPVYLETDTSVAALAEKNYGAAANVNDFIYVLISVGIGIGIIKDGEIYQAHPGMTGKQGHIVIDPQGPVCVCGKRGCLEAIAARTAILENARKILFDGRDQITSEFTSEDCQNISLSHISEAAQRGNIRAKNLIASMVDHITYAISLYTTILAIPFVIIGGEVPLELGDYFIQAINKDLQKYLRDEEKVTIIQAKLSSNGLLRGISMLTIQQILRENLLIL